MRIDRKITVVAGLALVLLIAFSAVASPPPLPSSFYGTIGASGFSVPSGTKVSAWVGGVKFAEVPVFIADGADGATAFVIDVPGDIPETAAVEGGREGETIVFKVGGAPAPQTAVWHTGNYERRDLTVAAGADVSVSVDDGQETAVPGTLLTYTLTVRNLGSQMAKGVILKDTLPSTVTVDSLDGGTLQGNTITWPAFDLEAGASSIRTVTVLVNLTLPVGTEAIVNDASVSHDGSLGLDPDPNNDSDQDSDALFLAPDFAITDSDLTVTPAQPAPGAVVNVSLTVRNPGFEDATGLVVIYNGRPYSGTVVGSQTVTVPKQGARPLTFSFTAGASTVVVSAAVDPDDEVDEVSEGNNTARKFLADVADLAIGIDNFLLTPTTARAGDAVAMKVTVRNGGRLAAADVPVEIFDGEPGFGGVSIFSTTIPSILPGGNQTVSFSWTATEGEHELTAVVDLADTILEMFETNNQAARDLRVPRAAGADLTVPSVDISGLTQSPVTLVAGGMVRATIANTGDAAAGVPFAARLFEDRDGNGVFSAGDRELARQEMPAGLAAGSSATAVFSVQGALEFHHPVLWVEVDADGAVAELKEDNNLGACFGGCEIPAPPSPGVTPVLEWYLGGMEVESAPMVAQLSDDNGDGKIDSRDVPDVVFIGEDSGGPAVMARSGVDGTEVWTYRGAAPELLSSRLSHVAVADLDGDGVAEVLAAARNGKLVAIDHHGQRLWGSDAVEGLTFRWMGGPSVADLTGDGVPEIVLGRTVLSNTGRKIAVGTADRGRNYWYYSGFGYPLHGRADDQAHSIVADVDLDGRPEIVAGSTLYRLEGNQMVVVWERVIPDNLMPDGFTAVANLDTDPQAEIVYVSSGLVIVLNHDGTIAINYRRLIPFSPVVQPNGWSGPPTIADLDGDGKPEILVAGATELVAMRSNLATYWRAPVFDVDAQTAATVFDLDGDGKPEVLYADQDNFYILNGLNGAVRHSRHITSKTANEYPVVADVDNDGQAEILVPSTTSFNNDDASTRGLHVLGNPGWRGTRPIWNQFSYHGTNVQLDGTVPSPVTPSWQAGNTYRVNEGQAARSHPRPNATVGLPRVGAPGSSGAPIKLRVGNGGRGVLPAGTAVVLYAGDPAQNPSQNIAAETKTIKALQPGEWQDLQVNWQRSGPAGAPATAVVDPQGLVEECDETDNSVGFGITETVLPDLAIPTGGMTVQASPVGGQLVTVNVKVENRGSAQAPASKIRLYDGPPSLGVRVGEASAPAIAPAANATVPVVWETVGAVGTHMVYAVADGEDTVVELDEANNEGSVPATLAAATKPDPAAEKLTIDPANPTVGTLVRLALDVANRGTALPAGFVVAFRVNNAEVARVTAAEPLETGGRRTVETTLQTLSLSGRQQIEARIDPSNVIAEQNEANNSQTGFLDILGSGLVATVRTDRVTYGSNQPVVLTVTAQNSNASPRTPVLRVTIQDGAGQVLATIQDQAVTLPPGSSTSSFSWPPGATPAGSYAAVAELVDNGSTVARGIAAFSISQDRMASAQLFADRSEYEPDQTVALTGRVRNTGVNASLSNLVAKLEIRSPGGTIVWTATRTIPLLSAGAEADVDGNWPVSNAAPGVYTASLDVREQGGASPQLAYAATQVTVLASSQTGTGLTSDLTVSPSPAGIGTVLLARFTARNAGNNAIPGLRLRLRLVRLSDGTDALLQELAWPLGQGEQKSGAVGIPTTGLAEGEYQVKLDAVLPTKTPTLASQDLTLVLGVSVRDAVVQERDGGTTTAVFEVALSSPSPVPVTVDYATSDGTAAAGSDYEATSGALTFAPDETTKTVAVPIHGDTVPEGDEVFLLSLANPNSVELADAQAIGEIEDEEGCASPNLLGNPGAEEGTLETDLPGWTPGVGGWTRRIADPAPIDGAASFATLAGGTAELVQEVDLTPFALQIDQQGLTLALAGFLRSGTDPARGRVIVEYRDAAGTAGANVLGSYDSGELASPDAWRAVSDARTVPAGTRRARVRLITSPGGTGAVFFDRLGLRSLGIPVLTAEDAEVTEGSSGTKLLRFRAQMSCAGLSGVTVSTATAAGTAAAGADFVATTGTLTFTPDALVQTVDVAIHGDTIDEQDETLRVVFTGGTGGTSAVVLTPQVAGTIVDDDGPVTVSIGDSTVTEGDSATADATFTVTLSDESGREVRAAWATANGTATPAATGADFVPASGTVVFPPGTTSQTVTVQVKGDLLDEPAESFFVRLSSPVQATIGDGEGEGQIQDNDEVLIAVTDVRLTEGDSGTKPATFTVSLSIPSVSTVTVQYATADGTALAPADYAAASGTLTFAPGTTSQTVTVLVAGELVKEPEEVFFLRLANPANASLGRPEGVGSILDDDGILISAGDVKVREGNGGTPAVPGNLSRAPGVTVRVSSAFPGYPGSRGIDGNLNTSWFTTNGDAANRGTRPFFEVVLPNLATVTELRMFGNREFASGFDFHRGIFQLLGNGSDVLYDSGEVELPAPNRDLVLTFPAVERVRRARFTATADESIEPGFAEFEVIGVFGTEAAAVVPITLSKAHTATVTVAFTTADGSAVAGADYQATAGTLVIPPGVTATSLVVPIVSDLVEEPVEAFELRLANATEAVILDGVGVTTIVDGDSWSLNGSAEDLSIPGCIVLTPDVDWLAASAWRTQRIDLNQHFDKTFKVFLGLKDGAEGITFALHNLGFQALGGNDGDLGASPLQPMLNIEVDTWKHSFDPIPQDHMTVNRNTAGGVTAVAPVVQASATSPDVEDGLEHDLRVVWNSVTKEFDAHFDGNERLTYREDVVSNLFGGVSSVIYGLTGATGNPGNLQYFCETELCRGTPAAPKISVGDARVTETDTGTVQAVFPVTLSCPTDHPVTVSFSTADGTAAAGADYLAAAGTLTFLPGETSKSVSVAVLGENLGESDEAFSLELAGPAGGDIRYGRGTGTIVSDEMGIFVDDVTTVEPSIAGGNVAVQVRLAGAFPSAITVQYATADGTARAGQDYTAASGTLTFQAGETLKTVFLSLVGDTLAEPDEQLFLRLSNPTHAAIEDGEAVVQLLDDDDCPTPNLLRNGGGEEALVNGDVPGWTEVLGTQWTRGFPTGGLLFPPPFQGSVFLYPGPPTTPVLSELRQDVDVSSFASPIDGGFQRFAFHSFLRTYPETPPDAARLVLEYRDATNSQVLASFDTGFITPTTVWLLVSDLRTAPAGTRFIRVRLIGERRYAGDPYTDAYFDAMALVALKTPGLRVDDASLAEGSSGVQTLSFPVTLTCAGTQPITVNYLTADGTATAGTDYQATFGTLTFAPGQTTGTINVPILGDVFTEGNETFSVNLASSVNAGIVRAPATGTILEDESTVSIKGTAAAGTAVTEGSSGQTPATFTVSLTKASNLPVSVDWTTVDGTATAGSDYVAASGTVQLNPNETSKTISVAVLGDTLVEPDETFLVRLSNPSLVTLGVAEATGTILQDDVTLSIGDASVLEGNTGTVDATFTVTLSQASTQAVSFKYKTEDRSATASQDYTAVTNGPGLIPAGATSTTVTVTVKGDTLAETGEIFAVVLFNPVNATILNGEGTGTIADDDDCPSPNLIKNPGNEDTLVNGEIPGWTEVVGTAWSQSGNAFAGNRKFAPGSVVDAELRQDVDVSVFASIIDAGIQRFSFSGWLFLGNSTPSDTGRIVLEYRDAANQNVLGTYDSGVPPLKGAWHQAASLGVAPPDTRWIRVRLIAHRVAASGTLDAYFDALELRTLGTAVLTVPDLPLAEGNAGTKPFTFPVTLNCAQTAPVTVDYATTAVNAEAGLDYTQASGTLTFQPGQTVLNVPVTVFGDTRVEGDEQFVFDLRNSSGPVLLISHVTGTILDDDRPASVALTGTLRDIKIPHPDFETVLGVDPGIVQPLLGPDKKPVYAGLAGNLTTHGQAAFDQWFRDVEGVNLAIPYTITLTPSSSDPRIFRFSDHTFWPIDNQLFGNQGNNHNFHMTYEIHSRFLYSGGETFRFFGDDDIWVFLNGKLAIDLGGVHQPDSATVDLDAKAAELGLVKGQVYDFDIFWAERHTVGSSFEMETTLAFGAVDPGVFQFSAPTYEVTESGTVATISVLRTRGADSEVSVTWSTANGTATAPSDYAATTGTLTFRDGETGPKTFTIPIADDATVEPAETVNVTLSNPTGGAELGLAAAVLTIQDDDTVSEPDLAASKTASLVADNDNNGQPSPGDVQRYEIVIENRGSGRATGVVLDDPAPLHTVVVAGSVTSTQGTIDTESPVKVSLGNLSAGASATVRFDVRIDTPLPAGVRDVRNQGMVASQELPTVLTDDPALGGDADVTVTAVTAAPVLVVEKTAALAADGDADGDGVPSPGDTIEYLVTVHNRGNTSATAVVVDDPVPARTSLVAGSVSPSQGTVSGTSPSVRVALGEIAGGASATVRFQVRVASPIPAGIREVSNQALVTSAELPQVPSDDPAVGGTADPTVTQITAAPVLAVEKKAMLAEDRDNDGVASPGDTLLYRVTVANRGNTPATAVTLRDAIDEDTAFETGSLQVSQGTITTEQPMEATLGEIGAGETTTVTFRVTVDTAFPTDRTEVANQARVISTELSEVLSDDPETAAPGDATRTPVFLTPSASINDVTVSEGAGTASLTVTLSFASNREVRIDYAMAGVSATAGVDFTAGNGTLVFAPGETTQTITVPVVDDLLDETDETFAVNLTNPVRSVLSDSEAIATITDDDAAPVVMVSSASVSESAGTAELTVTLSALSGLEVRVDYATADGSALAGADYTAATGTLVFPAGTTSLAVSVPVNNDALNEVDETFQVNLSNPVNVTVGSAATVTITDDDEEARAHITVTDVRVTEGNTGTKDAVFAIELADPSDVEVRVDYATANGTATAGTDYVATSGTLVFAPGEVRKTVTVKVKGDLLLEPDETFTLELDNAVGAVIDDGSGTGTIEDDEDCPGPNLLVNPGAEQGSSSSITSWREVVGSDWQVRTSSPSPAEGTRYFYAGQTSFAELAQDVNVAAYAAPIDLGVQTFAFQGKVRSRNENPSDTSRIVVEYRNAANNVVLDAFDTGEIASPLGWQQVVDSRPAPSGTRWIRVRLIAERFQGSTNDGYFDALSLRPLGTPAITIGDVTLIEGTSGTRDAVFNVTLSCPVGAEVSVAYATADGTAQAGSDYVEASGTLVFPAGATQRAIAVTVNGDQVNEPTETFKVNLSGAQPSDLVVIADPQGLGTITNGNTCSRSPGYWKNHTPAWPFQSLVMGGVTYNASQMLAFLRYGGSDASLHLARQLVTTRMNLAIGSDPAVAPIAATADAFLANVPPGSNPQGSLQSQANSIKDQLEAYNDRDCGN